LLYYYVFLVIIIIIPVNRQQQFSYDKSNVFVSSWQVLTDIVIIKWTIGQYGHGQGLQIQPRQTGDTYFKSVAGTSFQFFPGGAKF